MATTGLPYGLRDVKLTPYTDEAGTVLGTPVDLPNGRTFSFSETEDFEELRGDDTIVATVGSGASVEWSLEAGGISFEAVKVLVGTTITTSGVAPSVITTMSKRTTDVRPYFKVEGQAISDSGGDIHCVLDRCRVTGSFEGEFADGSFFLTSADGVALGSQQTGREDILYEFVHNSTVTPIA